MPIPRCFNFHSSIIEHEVIQTMLVLYSLCTRFFNFLYIALSIYICFLFLCANIPLNAYVQFAGDSLLESVDALLSPQWSLAIQFLNYGSRCLYYLNNISSPANICCVCFMKMILYYLKRFSFFHKSYYLESIKSNAFALTFPLKHILKFNRFMACQ